MLKFAPLVEGTMWDRPALSADQPATFVLETWIEAAFGCDIAIELRNAFIGTGQLDGCSQVHC